MVTKCSKWLNRALHLYLFAYFSCVQSLGFNSKRFTSTVCGACFLALSLSRKSIAPFSFRSFILFYIFTRISVSCKRSILLNALKFSSSFNCKSEVFLTLSHSSSHTSTKYIANRHRYQHESARNSEYEKKNVTTEQRRRRKRPRNGNS